MMKKLKERKGFTMAELLIVVAIVAVLVAVSIPVFTSHLEKSKQAADAANIRAAYAEAMVEAMNAEDGVGDVSTKATMQSDKWDKMPDDFNIAGVKKDKMTKVKDKTMDVKIDNTGVVTITSTP